MAPDFTHDTLMTDAAGVAGLAERVRAAGWMAIDTEFLWERTYAPQLCLVQIAVDDEVALLDPLAGAPLELIGGLLEDPTVEILMHAPAADLLAFGLRYGTVPTQIVDTQLMAGFAGLTASASLERLVSAVVKVALNHHESFSDWSRRPLSETQLHYAGDDVRYLRPLVDGLRATLSKRGRLEWSDAEHVRRFGDGSRVVPDPMNAWRKVARRGRLSNEQLAVLSELAAWREREARRRDLPASWVMKDPTLVELARTSPESPEAVMRTRGVAKGMGQGEVRSLLEAVKRGREVEPPPMRAVAPASVQRRVEAASGLAGALLKTRCSDAQLAPELVATRSEMERFLESVIGGDSVEAQPLGQGWRRDLVGDELMALIAGRVSLSLRQRSPYLRITPIEPDREAAAEAEAAEAAAAAGSADVSG